MIRGLPESLCQCWAMDDVTEGSSPSGATLRHKLAIRSIREDRDHDADPMQARRTGGVLPPRFLPSRQCIGEDSDGSPHSVQPAARRTP